MRTHKWVLGLPVFALRARLGASVMPASELAFATLGLPVFALRARLGASVMPASELAVATLGLPVFGRSRLAADRFPGFAFTVLLVEILQ